MYIVLYGRTTPIKSDIGAAIQILNVFTTNPAEEKRLGHVLPPLGTLLFYSLFIGYFSVFYYSKKKK